MSKQNGWRAQHTEHRRTFGARAKRMHRRKALERGEADPIFQPFSKRLAPKFQEAIERFMAERKQPAE